ncbi:MAG: RNA polymerase sigma factor [candidate division Zixibacteria bacterium]|nr:RNA polymerase sigma factor [candidate division Zixibacteria bacterium]
MEDINKFYIDAKNGSKKAEEQLFEFLTARFRLFVQRKIWNQGDGEELMQEALMTVFDKYKDVEKINNIAAWAHKVLNNKILNYFKTKALHENKLGELEQKAIGNKPISHDSTLELQLLDCLKKIGSINNRHARILNLHHHGYSVVEICEKLALTRNNLYSVLSRARSMLEHCLEKGDI